MATPKGLYEQQQTQNLADNKVYSTLSSTHPKQGSN